FQKARSHSGAGFFVNVMVVMVSNVAPVAVARSPISPRFSPKCSLSSNDMPASPRIVEVLAYPSVQLLDVTGPLQVFASANDLGASPQYQLRVVGQGTVTASAGIGLTTAPLPRRGAAIDTLVVPGGPGLEAALRDRGLVDFIRRRSREARRTASVCTG